MTEFNKPAWMKWTGKVSTEGPLRARVRLFCFPYAGGGSGVFRDWPAEFPAEIEVCPIQLPGRGGRWDEPPIEKMATLLEMLATDLHPLLNMPFALFGHSLGAILAFELAHYLRRHTGENPVHLFVSAARAPQLPDPDPPLSELSDAAFLQKLKELNGFPPEIINNQEFLDLILPTLRTDVRLCDAYQPSPGPPLDCPLSAYGGLQDDRVARAHIAGWKVQTTGRFKLRFFSGDHFFLTSARKQLMDAMVGDLEGALALTMTL